MATRIGINIGLSVVRNGPRYVLVNIIQPSLSNDGSGNWTITPGTYSNPEALTLTATYSLYKNGVYSSAVGLTFSDSTADTEFYVIEKVTASGTKTSSISSNTVYVPALPSYTSIPDASWTAVEATADVDTRKTTATVSYAPAASRSFYVYRGSTSPADDPTGVSVAAMTGSGSSWTWTSSGQAALGQIQYVRIMERDTATDTNRRWCSNVKTFTASNVPSAPTVSFRTGDGQGEIIATILAAAAENGRSITGYQYSLDGGSWTTLPGGVSVGDRVISGLTPVTSYSIRIRGVNINGNGTPTIAQSATSGAVAVEPAQMVAGTDWTLSDKPSAAGNTLTLTVVNLPSDGGSALTDIKYTINGGSAISFGLTPGSIDITVSLAEAANTVVVYAQNAIGNAVGSSLTKTPTKTTSASSTAYFGADTPAATGGWKPTTALGDEIDLTGIVSQTGMTRTWSISSGALVANGTPDVDNGKTLTVSTGTGNITVAISTVANARSVRGSTELAAAAATGLYAVPASVFLRPGTYAALSGGSQIWGSKSYASTAKRTFSRHPGQISKPIFLDSGIVSTALTYCEFNGFDFRITTGINKKIFDGNNTNVHHITFTDCDFSGPDIPIETLTSTTSFGTSGYNVVPTCIYGQRASDVVITGCTFRRFWSALDIGTGGSFVLDNCLFDTFYYDAIRLWPDSGNEVKFVTNIRITGAFAINNEMTAPSVGEPHNDSIQMFNTYGEMRNCLFMNIEIFRGPYRGDVLSMFQLNNVSRYNVIHNVIAYNAGVAWGYNAEDSRWVNISNSVFMASNGTSNIIRAGGPSGHATMKAVGEHVFTNVYVAGTSGTLIQVNANSETIDPGTRTRVNCVDSTTANPLNYFKGPFDSSIVDFTTLRAAFSAKDGSVTVGPLDASGNWRTEIHAPMRSNAPTLYDSGSDLLIAPSPTLYAPETPTTWDYQYRNANGASWTKVTGLTGATATLTAPNKTGIQVQTRWKSSTGFPAPWSSTQTTISSSPPLTNTAVPTLTRAGATVTKAANGTWTPTPDSRTWTKTINATTTSWDGTTGFTVAPGDSYYVTETAIKTGYTSTSVNSATGSYPILSTTAAPVIQISGTTVSLVSGPTWDATPDSVTYTKTIAGSQTSWDGTSNFSVSAGQSAYVTATPAKSGYYVTGAVSQSNTVTALTQITNTAVGTLARSGNTITLTPATWSVTPDSVARTYSVDGGTAQTLSGTTFTLNPGSSATVTETASKAGYVDSNPVTTSSITNPSAGTVYTEDWSTYAVGDTFTQLDTSYGRSSSVIDVLVASDTTAPGGQRINLTMSTNSPGYLRRDDTLITDGTWSRFQIRGRFRTQVHVNARGGIGWGSASSAYGIQIRRSSSSGTNTIALLNAGDMSSSTAGTTLFSSIADNTSYDFLLNLASDKRTLSYKVWLTSGSEPGSYDGSVTLGTDASLATGLRLFGGNISAGGNTTIRSLWWRLALDTDALAP